MNTWSTQIKNPFRICALCQHFRVLEVKREFPQIADSAYIRFGCDRVQESKREDYLMASNPLFQYGVGAEEAQDCPYWEAFEPT